MSDKTIEQQLAEELKIPIMPGKRTTWTSLAVKIWRKLVAEREARLQAERELAKALLLEEGNEPGEYFIPAEPGPLGPYTLVQAAANLMKLRDKWERDAEARAEKAERERDALKLVLTSTRNGCETAEAERDALRKLLGEVRMIASKMDCEACLAIEGMIKL